MMSNFPGHTRNQSAGQHLIVERQESGEEDEDAVEKGLGPATTNAPENAPAMAVTDSAGIFPGGPSPHDSPRSGLHGSKARRTRWDQMWTNRWSVLLAVLLFVGGSICLVLALYSIVVPAPAPYIGWWLVLPGMVAFLPGAYHCFYIACTMCGRDGYDLDNLPTFKR